MERITKINTIRERIRQFKADGKTIGFVPTMGYLHEGHLSLLDEAHRHADIVVMSVFVNPTQFGPNEDLESYPRDIERDEALAVRHGVDIVFYPEVKEMYPEKTLTWVTVGKITDVLCGASREGHFRGVTTVVTKLFNIVQPDIAVFGQKDAQQAAVIMRMVDDLNMSIKIIIAPIVRESDGLAMSSRNIRLSEDDRQHALVLSRSLFEIRSGLDRGEALPVLIENAKKAINGTDGVILEYLEARSYPGLEPVTDVKGSCLIAVAARVGSVRLIDNILVTGDE